MWLVGLEYFRHPSNTACWRLRQNSNEFNAPSAVAAHSRAAPAAMTHPRRRLPHPARPHPTRQPGRQASEELRRRGDAGREEGRPHGQRASAERQAAKRRSTFGRGRRAALSLSLALDRRRRVVVMARIVRHQGKRFRSAPLPSTSPISSARASPATAPTHGCSMPTPTRPTSKPSPSDARMTGIISGSSVSPEDAAEMADLRAFTRELMADAERDLGTKLDWVARRSLEHRQSARPCPDPRPRRRRPGPRHQPRLHQSGLSRSRRRARHPGAGPAQRAGNPIVPGEGSRGRALDQPRSGAAEHRR